MVNRDGEDFDDGNEKGDKKQDGSEFAYTFRKQMDDDDVNKFDFSEVEIESPGLIGLLRKHLGHYPAELLDGSTAYFYGPFEHFVHSWETLLKATMADSSDSEETMQARDDLSTLLKDIRGSNELESYFKNRENYLVSKTIRYDFLWTLFPPGAKVYARSFMNEPQIFECVSCYMARTASEHRGKVAFVHCAAYDWDGTAFQRRAYTFKIKAFEAPKAINTLPCYPLQYYQQDNGNYDSSALERSLIERAKSFIRLCVKQDDGFQYGYDGHVVIQSKRLAGRRDPDLVSRPLLTSG